MTRLHPPVAIEATRETLAETVAARLASGWRLALVVAREDADAFRLVYVLLRPGERCEVTLRVPREDCWFPSLATISYPCSRFEREVRDLYGIPVRDHPQPYRMVRHHTWPAHYYPMRSDADPSPVFNDNIPFPFVEVEGEGVYEIPVGPIHAGLIEPGHFRFTVVGETILDLRFRLWFMFRGMEKLFEGQAPADAVALAERISGDTAVGHTLAFVQAVEDALGVAVGERALLQRAVLLELERIYNHVGDLGAIVNDVGYGIAKAHCDALKEELLRENKRVTGHRLLRGGVSVGGASWLAEPDAALIADIVARADEVARVALAHPIVANRVNDQAVVTPVSAASFDCLGYVGRASGKATDARLDFPSVDLGDAFSPVVEPVGDVRARFEVRRREIGVSAQVIASLVERIRALPEVDTPTIPDAPGAGLGIVEGWRGTIVHRVELDADGRLGRVKIVDPSFFNWPAIAPALNDTIVPDFPLTNKSFNASYAGNDL